MTIGGFLEMEQNMGEEYHQKALRFNLGRNALIYVLKQLKYKKLLIPYYICDCIPKALERNQISYSFYHISETFRPIIEQKVMDDEAVLLVNYWGNLTEEELEYYQEKFSGKIILDDTQAFFHKCTGGYPIIYTCRKWFGVSDGAYLVGLNVGQDEYESFTYDESGRRLGHLGQKYENRNANLYAEYSALEAEFDESGIKRMSKVTQNILKGIDYARIQNKRKENWKILDDMLDRYNLIDMQSDSVPFMYVFQTENADDIREKLKEECIFLPTLWPNNLSLDPAWLEYQFAKELLLVPIDQRYNSEDMKFAGEAIKKNLAGRKG